MSDQYSKLWSSLITSTVWQEPLATKVVWITMLAMKDATGYVGAAIPGLAKIAGVTVEECEVAINRFLAPDKYSRTKEHEGRRIVEVDGGWTVLNHAKHRDGVDAERRREQVKQAARRYREKGKAASSTSSDSSSEKMMPDDNDDKSSHTDTDAATETEELTTQQQPRTRDEPESVRVRLILEALGLDPANGHRWDTWAGTIRGMMQGLGTPGMKAIDPDTLLCAAQDLAAAGGDVTKIRYAAFLKKLLEPEYVKPGKQGKGERALNNLVEWVHTGEEDNGK